MTAYSCSFLLIPAYSKTRQELTHLLASPPAQGIEINDLKWLLFHGLFMAYSQARNAHSLQMNSNSRKQP